MTKAYLHLIKFCLSRGMKVSVYDGEEWAVRRSTSYQEIKEAAESVEMARFRVIDPEGACVMTAVVSCYGLAADETVIDWSDNEFGDAWIEAYEESIGVA